MLRTKTKMKSAAILVDGGTLVFSSFGDFYFYGLLEVLGDVFLDDGAYGLFDFRACSEESSSWYSDGGTGFLECEELPELCLLGELNGSFVVSTCAVFLSSE